MLIISTVWNDEEFKNMTADILNSNLLDVIRMFDWSKQWSVLHLKTIENRIIIRFFPYNC